MLLVGYDAGGVLGGMVGCAACSGGGGGGGGGDDAAAACRVC